MTYKKALLFVGKCLALGIHPERSEEIVQQIRSRGVNWEKIVWVSSGQFVLPALYLQLKRASLLDKLPPDLVEYMQYLTDCNRERNQQILAQMKDIARLLNSHSIAPVFLKGTAHLLFDLYDDVAERMIGDIDFLVEEDQFELAAQLLIEAGYQPMVDFNQETTAITKHYPRMKNFNYPAAVEVHRQVLGYPNDRFFEAFEILAAKTKVELDGLNVFVPSVDHQIIHNVLNTQINDEACLYGKIILRQLYDMLLLSTHKNPQGVMNEYGRKNNMTNAYLALAAMVFHHPATIGYSRGAIVRFHIKKYRFFIEHPGAIHSAYKTTIYLFIRLSRYILLPIKSVYNKTVRVSVWARITNPQWYKGHVQSYLHYFKPPVQNED